MARAAVLWARKGTARLYKELNCLALCGDPDVVRSNVAGTHRVTIFAAVIVITQSRFTLLIPSFDARVFIIIDFETC